MAWLPKASYEYAPLLWLPSLLAGFDPRVRAERRLVFVSAEVFQASLDETGYQAADPKYPKDAFVFAGYVGKEADWGKFIQDWEPKLKNDPYLADAKTLKRLFRRRGRWSDPRSVDLMRMVTSNSGLWSVRWTLPYCEYREGILARAADDGEKGLYFFAWLAVLARLLSEIREVPHATLDLFYDENIVEEPKIQSGYEAFYQWLKRNRPEVAAMLPRRPTSRNDRDFWPLRAADALAWNTHRHFIRNAIGKRFSQFRTKSN